MTSEQAQGLQERRNVQMRVDIPTSNSRERQHSVTGANQSILVHQGEKPETNTNLANAHAHFAESPRERGQHDRAVSRSTSPSNPVHQQQQQQQQQEQQSEVLKQQSAPTTSGRATIKQASHPRIVHDDGKIHILVGVTGSLHLNTVKQIVIKLRSTYEERVSIHLILTKAAENMVKTSDVPGYVTVWSDEDEWKYWHHRSDPVIHIELRKWADVLLIAPCSANTLGKISLGLCDNLLTNVVRAWNPQNPIFIAPAMVSYAYNHPATKFHLSIIKQEMKWIEVLKPTEKVAGSYGGIGLGGMMAWTEISDKIIMKLGGYPDDDEDEDNEDEAAIDQNKAALRKQETLDDTVCDDDDDDDDDDDGDDSQSDS